MTDHLKNGELRQGLKELNVLHSISQALASSLELDVLRSVLDILAREMGMERGTLTLLDPQTQKIMIEAAKGMDRRQMRRGRYKLGEGITGKVVEAGEPIAIPNIGKEPLFLNRTRSRGDLSRQTIAFICVPIKYAGKTIGALSVDRLFEQPVSLQEDVRLLATIASMIAQAVRLRQQVRTEHVRLEEENTDLRRQLKTRYHVENIIGSSRAMQDVFRVVHQCARSKATVLLLGESGTGKELIARALHYMSPRSDGPFVRISAASIPETLLESELFGYEKGAFTGALARKPGRFELAHGGTLFLDEVGDLTLAAQVKMLRVLQEREFERVGGTETIKVDVRIIAATNRPLDQEVREKRFREDLYYRLNVITIYLPPLRERREDIPELVDYFISRSGKEHGKAVERPAQDAMDVLITYPWPGNVRELENCMERAVVMAEGHVVRRRDLPSNIRHKVVPHYAEERFHEGNAGRLSLTDSVKALEARLIQEALNTSRGNQSRAAKMLGITERILGYKAKKYKIVSSI
ncbi:MAG: sigma 54-interacting transcriptional regulator [Candidatus Omnitrophica bacterium]|nr:sigma 54-interacting transcriptional regulator [Candidatus Omnitrophota bacterium]